MTRPTLPSDRGYIGDRKRGAGMGRADRASLCPSASRKFYLQRIKPKRQAYDTGGAYWGTGDAVYWACCPSGTIDHFVWAADREAAKAAVLRLHPGASFYR